MQRLVSHESRDWCHMTAEAGVMAEVSHVTAEAGVM